MRKPPLLFVFILATMPWNAATPDVPTRPTSLQDEPKEKPPAKRKPSFTIGKEMTYVDGPIDKDGHIDYAAALNKKLSQDVTPDNNAVVLMWKAHGPQPDGRPIPAPGTYA